MAAITARMRAAVITGLLKIIMCLGGRANQSRLRYRESITFIDGTPVSQIDFAGALDHLAKVFDMAAKGASPR